MMNEKEYKLYLDRIRKFYASLEEEVWGEAHPLNARIAVSRVPVRYRERESGAFRPIGEGEVWGELWESAWLHIDDAIPDDLRRGTVALRLSLGGEALIFSQDGMPRYGLTNTSVFASCYRKEIYRLSEEETASGRLDLWLELAANGLLGDENNPDVPQQKCDIGVVKHLKLCEFFPEVWALKLDLEVMFGLMNLERPAGDFVFGHAAFPADSRRMTYLVRLLNRAIDAYAHNPANATVARAVLAGELARPAASSAMSVTAVGHAHIDTGWLWPVRETIRKCARTFASQLSLMERYPDYVFGASQPQHYAFVKEHYPALFEAIKQRVIEGRWELQGAMWVEADCNLIGGESMVRQFVHGKNFYRKEFGVEVTNLWLPDVFGYSGALPQIIRKSGCEYFLTQKICWNQFNRFPYHAFTWHGIDGSEVLTFFPPEDTYNSLLVPDQLNYGCDNLTENYLLDESLTLFGIGNGGGGPKEEHLERSLRCRDLEGSPRVRFGRADDFFARLGEHRRELPHWHGELYFEEHRGTLTTQARNKRDNRRAEQELLETEFIAALLPLAEYPEEKLDQAWKTLLLNQFHDIIPGSSIREVYATADREYQEIFQTLDTIRRNTVTSQGVVDEDAVTLINTLSYPYNRLIELPEHCSGSRWCCNGSPVTTQGRFAQLTLPPQSITALHREGELVTEPELEFAYSPVLENSLIRYEFNERGQLIHAFDKELLREMLSAPANVLSLYHDVPNSYDAWNIDLFYENELQETAKLTGAETLECGALLQCNRLTFSIGESEITQFVSLEKNSKRLEFHTLANWRESCKMLHVSFPTSIVSNECACEIQYGYVKRETHRNTSWNLAQFEMAAHRYVDLSDEHCGIALLNDCKYGHKVLDGVLDLNILRSPSWPDSEADRGEHEFTYALLPHCGRLPESPVLQEAAMLNRKCRVFDGIACEALFPCRMKNGDNKLTLEVLKKAENSGHYVIRIADLSGVGGAVELEMNSAYTVVETDLMEREDGVAIPTEGKTLRIQCTPFEIRTFLLIPSC